MINNCDMMRVEIRKGKFVFKMAVRGKTNTLPFKSLKHEKREPLHSKRKPVEKKATEDDERLPNVKNSPKVEEKRPEIEENILKLDKMEGIIENEESSDQNGNIASFPPIQLCERHVGSWQSSAMSDDSNDSVSRETKRSDCTDDRNSLCEKDERNFSLTERALIHEHYSKESGCESSETGSDILTKDNSSRDSNFVTDEQLETPAAEVVIETKHFDRSCDFGNPEAEVKDDDEPCEYNYILDSDEFHCDSSLDVSESNIYTTEYTEVKNKAIIEAHNYIPSQEKPEDVFINSNMDVESCIDESSNGADDNTFCIDALSAGRIETDQEGSNIGEASQDKNISVNFKMAADEGEETETEFDPLEGDEWEGMETCDVTSCEQEKNAEESERDSDQWSESDEESSASDFEDLIGQYAAYMPKEISRSVNVKRRAARVPPTSATYRRCSSELKRFFCEKCGISYKSFTDYQSHKKTHGENKCEVCFKIFNNSRSLLVHSNIHIGDNLSTCSFCKMAFINKKSLYMHIQKQHLPHMSYKTIIDIIKSKSDYRLSLKKFTKPIPKIRSRSDGADKKSSEKKRTSDEPEYDKQRKTLKTAPNSGKDRSRSRKDARSLEDSMSRHDEEKSSKDRCTNFHFKKTPKSCYSRYRSTYEERASNSQEKKIPKPHVENGTRSRIEEKTKQIEKATGVKLKECHVCVKKFEPRILERHMRSHTGEKPYLCDRCPFRCSQLGNLNKHVAVVHRDSSGTEDERVLTHQCDICYKRFYDAAHLKRHALTHMERSVKLYTCSVCGKTFRFDTGLRRHMQLHKDGLRIRCGICDRGFYDSSGLNNHLKLHTHDQPYKCAQCRVSFSSAHALNRHKSMHRKKTRDDDRK